MEDLDRVTSSVEHERRQLADLAAIGLDWDGDVVRQSDGSSATARRSRCSNEHGLVYPCYCTRREIRRGDRRRGERAHGASRPTDIRGRVATSRAAERAEREAVGRPAALRLRTEHQQIEIVDLLVGNHRGTVDDVVLAAG